jgi:hypothetical protein
MDPIDFKRRAGSLIWALQLSFLFVCLFAKMSYGSVIQVLLISLSATSSHECYANTRAIAEESCPYFLKSGAFIFCVHSCINTL